MSETQKNRLIFEGRILHFEDKPGGMLVDWFNGDIKNLYFVSHAHTDHLKGLAYEQNEIFCKSLSSSPHTKIYCTRITADLILRLPSIIKDTELKTDLEKHFEILESNGETTIDFYDKDGTLSGKHMTVRTIPANHIPGAVMFLFDDGVKCALYTGDFRYDVRENNEEMSALTEFVEQYDKTLDYLYVDVTCLDLGRLYHPNQNKLPSRSQIKEEVCRLIEKRGVKSVHLDADLLGAEEMVKAVAERLNNPVDDILERLPKDCPKTDLYEYLLKDIKCTGPTCNTTLHISSKGCFNKRFFCEFCKDNWDNTLKIRATLAWVFEFQYDYSFDNRNTWTNQMTVQMDKPKDCDPKEKKILQAIFSHHSSHYELIKFLQPLKFKEIYPISIPFDRKYRDIYTKRPQLEDEAQVMQLQHVKEGLYYSIDSSCLQRKLLNVFYFSNDKNQINLSEFKINKKEYKQADDILSVIEKCPPEESIDFVTISCSSELRDSIGQMDCILYRFIDELWKWLVIHEKNAVKKTNECSQTKAVILYSTEDDDRNEQIRGFVERYNRLVRDGRRCNTFYLDLTKVGAYTESGCKQETEVDILQETLSNIVRNQDREVFASDWPMPYKYSERKREYDLAKQKREQGEDRELRGEKRKIGNRGKRNRRVRRLR